MLSIIKEVSDFEFRNELWSGAVDTIQTIIEKDRLSDLMDLLEELYPEPVDITTINDLLWFDDEYIFGQLGIKLNDDCVYALQA